MDYRRDARGIYINVQPKPRKIIDIRHVRMLCYEGAAALLYVLFGSLLRAPTVSSEFASLASGMTTVIVMVLLRGTSGNPSTLLASLFARRYNALGCFFGIVGQFFGALIGSLIAYYFAGIDVKPPQVAPGFPAGNALVIEIVVITVSITASISVSRFANEDVSRPLFAGITISVCGWVSNIYTGACVNIWLHLTNAIVSGVWASGWWIYYVAASVATVLAPLAAWGFNMVTNFKGDVISDYRDNQ